MGAGLGEGAGEGNGVNPQSRSPHTMWGLNHVSLRAACLSTLTEGRGRPRIACGDLCVRIRGNAA